MNLAPGARCGMRFTKFDGTRHWEYDGVILGTDEHGTWFYSPRGTPMARPGRALSSHCAWVTCVPDQGGWVLVVNDPVPDEQGRPQQRIHRYVDITTTPAWEVRDGLPVATCIDLDLDVVRVFPGFENVPEVGRPNPYVDDEDEFAEHQVRFGYPGSVVTAAETECATVLAVMRAQTGPFGAAGQAWLSLGIERHGLGEGPAFDPGAHWVGSEVVPPE